MSKLINIVGQKYGRLLVLEKAESQKGRTLWKCLCDCGNEVVIQGLLLKNGHTKSCGCLRKEMAAEAKTTHGMGKTKLNYVWLDMKGRCLRPTHRSYKNYGGRGITYTKDWETFEGFYADMGSTYQEGLTLDRIDNNKGYSKDNCRWTTVLIQNNNKRNSALETVDGITATRSQLSDMYGIPRCTFYWRINAGMSVEEALKTPRRKPKLNR